MFGTTFRLVFDIHLLFLFVSQEERTLNKPPTMHLHIQYLPEKASITDVPQFFPHCDIPLGNIWILGGIMGDTVVTFRTHEELYKALMLDGMPRFGSQLKLSLAASDDLGTILQEKYELETTSHGNQNPLINTSGSCVKETGVKRQYPFSVNIAPDPLPLHPPLPFPPTPPPKQFRYECPPQPPIPNVVRGSHSSLYFHPGKCSSVGKKSNIWSNPAGVKQTNVRPISVPKCSVKKQTNNVKNSEESVKAVVLTDARGIGLDEVFDAREVRNVKVLAETGCEETVSSQLFKIISLKPEFIIITNGISDLISVGNDTAGKCFRYATIDEAVTVWSKYKAHMRYFPKRLQTLK